MNEKAAEIRSQEMLCEKCLWKQSMGENKVLCFFGRCIYEKVKSDAHDAECVYTEYADRLTGRKIITEVKFNRQKVKPKSKSK